MNRTPLTPPVSVIPGGFRPLPQLPASEIKPLTRKSFIDRDMGDWKVEVATTLANAVPANIDHTTITIHRHQIIVERSDNLYRVVSLAENLLLIASSALLVGLSATAVIFAFNTISGFNG